MAVVSLLRVDTGYYDGEKEDGADGLQLSFHPNLVTDKRCGFGKSLPLSEPQLLAL